MTTINKIACSNYSFAAGDGVTTFYEPGGEDITEALGAFWTAVKNQAPDDWSLTVPDVGESLDDVTGSISGTWTGGTTTTVSGEGAGTYTAGAGASIRWLTSGFVGGRRIVGRTFIIPLNGDNYDNTGQLGTAAVGALKVAADALISAASGNLLIWHRPVSGAGGATFPVTGASISKTPANLRSRKV